MFTLLVIIILSCKYTYQYYLDYINKSQKDVYKSLDAYKHIYLMWILYLSIFFKNLIYPFAFLGHCFHFHYSFFFILIGASLSYWSISTLGPQYSDSIVIWQNHILIQDGPYLLFRHPQRLGVSLELFGLLLLHISWICSLIFVIFASIQLRRSYIESKFIDSNLEHFY